jgi:predicted lipoprotein with Yx(FWY)xxD motif
VTKPSTLYGSLAAISVIALLAGCTPRSYQAQQASTYQARPASAAPNQYVFMRTNTSAGTVISSNDGMTLYTYTKDTPGVSNCVGPCATVWHPYVADGSYKPFGNMTIITRSDGTHQWAYKGMPLYTYSQDTAPGEVKGVGVDNNTWHVVAVQA